MSKFSTNLRRLRRKRGYSQEELGGKINVSRQMISRYENGISEPGNDTMEALAAALDVCIGQLFGKCHLEKIMKEDLK